MRRETKQPRVVVKRVAPEAGVAEVTQAVEAAVKALGGISRFVARGETVVLKPNAARPLEPGNPENTDWRVVEAAVTLAKKARPKRIVIAEGAFGMNTLECFEKTGVAEVARRHGVELIDINKEEFAKVRVRRGVVLKEVEVARCVLEADRLINLPAMKASIDVTTELGQEYPISMAMKNLKGVISPAARKHFHDVGYQRAVADLSSVVRSDLVIMSGLRACVTEAWAVLRRQPGLPLGLVLAGGEAVAVDAVASAVLGSEPMAIEQIRVAAEKGWGTADLERIELVSEVPFEALRAEIVQRIFEARERARRGKRPPVIIHEFDACTGCRVALMNAMNQVGGALGGRRRLHVVLGQHAQAVARVRRCLYLGKCTARVAPGGYVRGCPPTEAAIQRAILKAFR
jgi:uncharacterized protein (DUF362 family)